jgi:hypothetical protein
MYRAVYDAQMGISKAKASTQSALTWAPAVVRRWEGIVGIVLELFLFYSPNSWHPTICSFYSRIVTIPIL